MSASMAKANAELRAENEALRAERDAEAALPMVRERWIPQPGHPTPELVGVSLHTLDGTNWAIRHESILGMRAWTPDGWTAPMFVVSKERAYCWTLEQAAAEGHTVADMLARQEAEAQPEPVTAEFAREMADEVEQLVDTVREAVAS